MWYKHTMAYFSELKREGHPDTCCNMNEPLLEETLTESAHPAGTIVTASVSYFTTGGSHKEHGTNKPPPIGRIQEMSKGDTTCPTNLPESFLLASILTEQCVSHQEGPESE